MPATEHHDPANTSQSAGKTSADHSLVSKIEVSKVIDLIVSKQTQYYTLWGVYTAVQFAVGGYGYGRPLPLGVGLAVLLGVWAFNFGHLSFVLECVAQLNKLGDALKAAVDNEPNDQSKLQKASYQSALQKALEEMQKGGWFWRHFKREEKHLKSYVMNSFVHFLIDICASLALLIRVDNPWIQDRVPDFLKATVSPVVMF